MTHLLVHLALMTVAIYLTAMLVPGFRIKGLGTAVGVAVVYGVLNTLLYKIVFLLTFPIALLTLGLAVNMVLLWLTSKIVPSMEISGILPLFVASLLIVLISHGLYLVLI